MPTGSGPPDPCLSATVFNALHAMTYDAANLAFKDAGGSTYWLFVQVKGGTGSVYDEASWFHATDTDGATSPKGLINSATSTVILGGTYDATNQWIVYRTAHYRIRLRRDTTTGQQLAEAHAI